MKKYILEIDGMMCGHCEAHMNETIKSNFDVKKVESSHSKKQCVIVADDLDENKLKNVVAETGYELKSISQKPYQKKTVFAKLKR